MLEDGFPVYGANGRIGFTDNFTHEQPTILIGCRGSCGSVHVTEACSYATGNAMALDELDEKRVDLRFLRLFLQNRGFYDVITGSSQPQIIRQNLVRVEVPIPPLPEQRRIAAILDQADTLRAKHRCASEHVGQLAQALFSDAFGDPSKNLKDWPTSPLTSLIADGDSINYGVIQPGAEFGDGIPLVRVSDLHGGHVNHQDIKRISPEIEKYYKRSRLRGDEILVSCVGSIGIVALARESERGFNIARAVARIRVNSHVRREFISTYLQTQHVQDYFSRELRTSSQPTLNIKQIGETPVPVPPIRDQDSFVNLLNVASDLQAKTLRQGQLIEGLFTSLQHHAFTGAL